MGTEYTTVLWTRPYVNKEAAKNGARKAATRSAFKENWQKHSNGAESWDAGAYIFTVKSSEIEK